VTIVNNWAAGSVREAVDVDLIARRIVFQMDA
jgi:hypothetical protein